MSCADSSNAAIYSIAGGGECESGHSAILKPWKPSRANCHFRECSADGPTIYPSFHAIRRNRPVWEIGTAFASDQAPDRQRVKVDNPARPTTKVSVGRSH